MLEVKAKERLTKDYIEVRLQSLEGMWYQFVDNHKELLKSNKPAELQSSSYMKTDMYSETEEVYLDCHCIMKAALSKYIKESQNHGECNSGSSKNNSSAKLPKIIIPKFSGEYNEWRAFRDLFLSLVHNSDMENIQKMQYLKGLLSGEAEQLVRHVNLTGDNYIRCWEMLEARYNNKRFLCNTILKRLFAQPTVHTESASFMRELLDTTSECLGALTSLGVDVSGWDTIMVYITALRLDQESQKQWEVQSANTMDLPTWKTFVEFLTNRFRALEFVDSDSNRKKPQYSKSFHISDETSSNVSCKYCKESHKLAHCNKFLSAEVQARREFVEKNNICYNCLGDNHRAQQCLSLMSCRKCRRRHHTHLHLTNMSSGDFWTGNKVSHTGNASEEATAPVVCNASEETDSPVVCFASGRMTSSSEVLLATALVRAQSCNGDTRIIRALLDQGSQASFVTEATAQYLGLKRIPIRGVISGLRGSKNASSNSMANITITSIYDQNVSINLNVYVLKSITTLLPSRAVATTDWVLDDISLAYPKYDVPNKIDMLLGAAIYGQVVQEGVRKNPEGTLLAQNTTLGWILSGNVSNQDHKEVHVVSMHIGVEDLQLKKFWELKADPKAKNNVILTDEEKHCEKLFEETTVRDEQGRYVVRLPFKSEDRDLKAENTKGIAKRRLNLLLVKLGKDNEMKTKYKEVIN